MHHLRALHFPAGINLNRNSSRTTVFLQEINNTVDRELEQNANTTAGSDDGEGPE